MIFKKFSFRTNSTVGNQGIGVDISVDSETDEQKRKRLQEKIGLLRDEANQSAGVLPEEWGTNAPLTPYVSPVPPLVPGGFGVDPVASKLARPTNLPVEDPLTINRTLPVTQPYNPLDPTVRANLVAHAQDSILNRQRGILEPNTIAPSLSTAASGSSGALGDSVVGSALSSLWQGPAQRRGADPLVDAFANDPYGSQDALAKQMTSTLMGERIEGGGWFQPQMALKQVTYGAVGQIGDFMKYIAAQQGGNDRLENAGRMLSALGQGARNAATTDAEAGRTVAPTDAGWITQSIIGTQNSIGNADWWTYTFAENIGRMLPLMVTTSVAPELGVTRGAIALGGKATPYLEVLFPSVMSWLEKSSAPVIEALAARLGTNTVAGVVARRAVGTAGQTLGSSFEYNVVSAVTESLQEAAETSDKIIREGGSFKEANLASGRVFNQGVVALMMTNGAEDFMANYFLPKIVSKVLNGSAPAAKRSLLRNLAQNATEGGVKFAFNVYKEMTEEMLQEAIQQNLGGSLLGNLAVGATPYPFQTNADVRRAGEGGAQFALGFALSGNANLRSIAMAQQGLQTLKNVKTIYSADLTNTNTPFLVATTVDLAEKTIDAKTTSEISAPNLTQDQIEIIKQEGLELKERARELFGVNEAFDPESTPKTRFERVQYAWNQNRANEFLNTIRSMHPQGEAGWQALIDERLGELARRSSETGNFEGGQYGPEQRTVINGVPVVNVTGAITPEQFNKVAQQPYMVQVADAVASISQELATAWDNALKNANNISIETNNEQQSPLTNLIISMRQSGYFSSEDVTNPFKPMEISIGNVSLGVQRADQTAIDVHTIGNEVTNELTYAWNANENGEQEQTLDAFLRANVQKAFQERLVGTAAHELGHTIGLNDVYGVVANVNLYDFFVGRIISSGKDILTEDAYNKLSALSYQLTRDPEFIKDREEIQQSVTSRVNAIRQFDTTSRGQPRNQPRGAAGPADDRERVGQPSIGADGGGADGRAGIDGPVSDALRSSQANAPGLAPGTGMGFGESRQPIGPDARAIDAGTTDAGTTATRPIQQPSADETGTYGSATGSSSATSTDAGTTDEQGDTSGVRLSPEEETAAYRDLAASRQTIRSRVASITTPLGTVVDGVDLRGLDLMRTDRFGRRTALSLADFIVRADAQGTGNPIGYEPDSVAASVQEVIEKATAQGRMPTMQDFWDAETPGAPRPFDSTKSKYFQSTALTGIPHPDLYGFLLHLADKGKGSGSWYLNVGQFLTDYVQKKLAQTNEAKDVSKKDLNSIVEELLGYMGRSGQETTPRTNMGWAFQFLELRLLLQDTPSTATNPKTKKPYKNALDEVVQTNIAIIAEQDRLQTVVDQNKDSEWIIALKALSKSPSQDIKTIINSIFTNQFSVPLGFVSDTGKPMLGHIYKYGNILKVSESLNGKSFAQTLIDNNGISFADNKQQSLFIKNVNEIYQSVVNKKLLNERVFGTMKPTSLMEGLNQYAPNKIDIAAMGKSGSAPVEVALDFWTKGSVEIESNMKLAQYYGAFRESLFNAFTMFSVPDRWMFKSFGMIDPDKQSTASNAQASEFLMTIVADIASKLDGVTPTQLQAMIWTGLRMSLLDPSSTEIAMTDPYYEQSGNRQPRSLWGSSEKGGTWEEKKGSVVIQDQNGEPWSVFSGSKSDANSAGEIADIFGAEDNTFFKKLTKLMDSTIRSIGSISGKKQSIALNPPRIAITPAYQTDPQSRVDSTERRFPIRNAVDYSGAGTTGVVATGDARSRGQAGIEATSPTIIVPIGKVPLKIVAGTNQLEVLRQESAISQTPLNTLGVPVQKGQQDVTNLQRTLTRLPFAQRSIEDSQKNYVPHYVVKTDDHYEVVLVGATPAYARIIASVLAAKAGVPTAQVWIPRATSNTTSTDPYTMRRNEAETLAVTAPDGGTWTIKDAGALVSNVLQSSDQWTLGVGGTMILINPANTADLGSIADALVTVNNVPKESINVTNVDMMEPVAANPNASIRPYMQKDAPNFLQVFRNNTGIQSSRASDRPRGPLMGFPRARPLDPQGVTPDEWNDMIRNPESGEVSIFNEDGVWYGTHKDGTPFVVDPYDGRQRSLMKLPYVGERPVDPNAPVASPPPVSDRDMDVFNASLESTKKYYTDQGLPVPERVQQQMDAQIREMREKRERGTIRSNRTAAIPRIDQLDEMRDRGSIDRKILRDRQSMYGLGTSPTFFQDFATNVNFKTLLDNPFLSVSIPLNFGGSVSQALGIDAGNMYSDMQGDPKRYQIDALENVFNAVPATGTMAKSIANILKVPDTYYQIPALTAIVGNHVILTGRYGSWFSEGVTGLEANVRVVLEKGVSLEKARAAAAFLGAVTLQDGVGLWSPKSALPVKKWMDLGSTIGRLVSIVKNKLPQVLESEKAIVDSIKDSIAFQDQEDLQTALGKIFALMGLQTDQTIMPQLERALASAFPNGVVPTGPGARTGVNLWGNLKTNGNPDPLMRYLGITRDALNTNVIGIKTNEGMTTPATMAKVANALNQLGFGSVDLDTAGKHVVFIDYSPFTYNQDMTFGQVAKLVAVQQLKFATAMKLISDNNIASPKDMFVGTWANELVAVQDAPTPGAVWWASGALPTTDVAGNPASSGSVLFDPNGRSDAQTFQPVKTVPDLGTRAGFSAPWGGVPGRSYTTGRAMVKDVPVPSRTFGTMLEDWARNNPNDAIRFKQAVASALGNLSSIGIGNGSINPGAVGGVLENYGVSDLADAYKEWLNKNIKTDPAGQQISDPNPAASREALSTYAGDASTRLIIQSSRATVRPDTDTLVDSISKQTPASMEDREFPPFTRVGSGQMAPSKYGKLISDPIAIKSSRAQVTDQMREESKDKWVYTGDQWIRDFGSGVWGRVLRRASVDPKAFESGQPIAHAYRWGVGVSDANNSALIAQKLANMTLYGQVDHQFITDAGVASVMYGRLQNSVFNKSGNQPTLDMTAANVNAMEAIRFAQMRGADIVAFAAAAEAYLEQYGLKVFLSKYIKEDNKANEILYYIKSRYNDQRSQQIMDVNQSDDSQPVNRNYAGDDFLRLKDMLAYGVGMATAPDLQGSYGSSLQVPRPFFSRPQFGDDFALIADVIDNKLGKKKKVLKPEQIANYDMFENLEDISRLGSKLSIDYNVMQGNSGIAREYEAFNKTPDDQKRITDFWELWDLWQKRNRVADTFTKRGTIRGVVGRGAIRSSRAANTPPPEFIDPATGALYTGLTFENGMLKALRIANTKRGNAIMNAGMYNGEVLPVVGFREAWQNARDAIMLGLPAGVDKSKAVIDLIMVDGRASSKMFEDAMLGSLGHDVHFLSALDANGTPIVKASDFSGTPGSYSSHDHVLTPVVSRPFAETYPDDPTDNTGYADRTVRGPSSGFFVMHDTGGGMSPAKLATTFIQMFASGKEKSGTNTNSSGGFGLGVGAIFSASQYFEVMTTWRDPQTGKLVRAVLSGSGEDFSDTDVGVTPRIISRDVEGDGLPMHPDPHRELALQQIARAEANLNGGEVATYYNASRSATDKKWRGRTESLKVLNFDESDPQRAIGWHPELSRDNMGAGAFVGAFASWTDTVSALVRGYDLVEGQRVPLSAPNGSVSATVRSYYDEARRRFMAFGQDNQAWQQYVKLRNLDPSLQGMGPYTADTMPARTRPAGLDDVLLGATALEGALLTYDPSMQSNNPAANPYLISDTRNPSDPKRMGMTKTMAEWAQIALQRDPSLMDRYMQGRPNMLEDSSNWGTGTTITVWPGEKVGIHSVDKGRTTPGSEHLVSKKIEQAIEIGQKLAYTNTDPFFTNVAFVTQGIGPNDDASRPGGFNKVRGYRQGARQLPEYGNAAYLDYANPTIYSRETLSPMDVTDPATGSVHQEWPDSGGHWRIYNPYAQSNPEWKDSNLFAPPSGVISSVQLEPLRMYDGKTGTLASTTASPAQLIDGAGGGASFGISGNLYRSFISGTNMVMMNPNRNWEKSAQGIMVFPPSGQGVNYTDSSGTVVGSFDISYTDTSDLPTSTTIYLSNGSYQYSTVSSSDEAASRPDAIIINIHPSVDPTSQGYPINPDRDNVKSWFSGQPLSWISTNIDAAIRDSHKQKVWQALSSGFGINGYDNAVSNVTKPIMLLDAGKTFDPSVIQGLSQERWVVRLADSLTEFYDEFMETFKDLAYQYKISETSDISRNQDWFNVVFAGLTMQKDLVAVNYNTRAVAPATTYRSQSGVTTNIPRYVMVNPFVTVAKAADRTAGSGVASISNKNLTIDVLTDLVNLIRDSFNSAPTNMTTAQLIRYWENEEARNDAAFRAARRQTGQPPIARPDGLLRKAREFVIQLQTAVWHEITHQSVSGHNESFGRALQQNLEAIRHISTVADMSKKLLEIVLENDGEILNNLAQFIIDNPDVLYKKDDANVRLGLAVPQTVANEDAQGVNDGIYGESAGQEYGDARNSANGGEQLGGQGIQYGRENPDRGTSLRSSRGEMGNQFGRDNGLSSRENGFGDIGRDGSGVSSNADGIRSSRVGRFLQPYKTPPPTPIGPLPAVALSPLGQQLYESNLLPIQGPEIDARVAAGKFGPDIKAGQVPPEWIATSALWGNTKSKPVKGELVKRGGERVGSFWYMNTLSAPAGAMVDIISNALTIPTTLLRETGAMMIERMAGVPREQRTASMEKLYGAVSSMWSSTMNAGRDALDAFAQGMEPIRGEQPRGFTTGKKGMFLETVGRSRIAADVFVNNLTLQMAVHAIAHREAGKTEKFGTPAYKSLVLAHIQKMSEELANGTPEWVETWDEIENAYFSQPKAQAPGSRYPYGPAYPRTASDPNARPIKQKGTSYEVRKQVSQSSEGLAGEALRQARENVFQERAPHLISLIADQRGVAKGVLQAMIPFYKTIATIGYRGAVNLTPMGLPGIAYDAATAAITDSGPSGRLNSRNPEEHFLVRQPKSREYLPMSQRLGYQMIGMTVAMMASAAFLAGMATGAGPDDEEEKKAMMAEGWRPWSFLTKDANGKKTYTAIVNVLGPLSYPVVFGVAWSETHQKSGVLDPAAFGAFAASMWDFTFTQSGLKSYKEAFDALEGGRDMAKIKQAVSRYASGFVPYISLGRAINNAIDDTVRDPRSVVNHYTGNQAMDEWLSYFAQSAQEGIPGMSSNLPPKRNEIGQIERRSPGQTGARAFFPFQSTEDQRRNRGQYRYIASNSQAEDVTTTKAKSFVNQYERDVNLGIRSTRPTSQQVRLSQREQSDYFKTLRERELQRQRKEEVANTPAGFR